MPPGHALAASGPPAKCSPRPGPGTGTRGRGSSRSRETEPPGSAAAPRRAASRGRPATRVPPPTSPLPGRRDVPQRASPQLAGGRGERGTGREPPGPGDLPRAARGASRAPARASRRARAGGAGGGRAAIVAGLQCSSSRAGRRALHHPTRAPSGGRASRPEGFPAAGRQLRSPRAAPGRRGARLGFHFFKKVFPGVSVCVCARALFWHEPALTVAIKEQTVRVGPGTRKIVRERRQACEMDPRPTVTVLITTEQIIVSPAAPARRRRPAGPRDRSGSPARVPPRAGARSPTPGAARCRAPPGPRAPAAQTWLGGSAGAGSAHIPAPG